MFIPDPGSVFSYPGSMVKKIPDPDPHERIEVLLIQKLFVRSLKYCMIRDVHPGSYY
jgi:hypothetical protein